MSGAQPESHEEMLGLPRADEAERAVLGVLLSFPAATARIRPHLPLEALYSIRHQTILRAAYTIDAHGGHVDIVTVSDYLRRQGEYELAGCDHGLMDLANGVVSTAGLESYVALVLEYWICRDLIAWARSLNEIAFKTPFALASALREASATYDKILAAADRLRDFPRAFRGGAG